MYPYDPAKRLTGTREMLGDPKFLRDLLDQVRYLDRVAPGCRAWSFDMHSSWAGGSACEDTYRFVYRRAGESRFLSLEWDDRAEGSLAVSDISKDGEDAITDSNLAVAGGTELFLDKLLSLVWNLDVSGAEAMGISRED